MSRYVIIAIAVSTLLAGCGGPETPAANQAAEKSPPLYTDPPFGASDIDSTVEETRRRSAPSAPDRSQDMAPANVQDSSASTVENTTKN